MRVLLDESVPRKLASAFPESFETRTVQQMGWAGCSNGELLYRAADHGFGVVVTVDQGFAYQQSVRDLPIPVVILIAGRTRLQELWPLVPEVIAVLSDDPGRRIHRVLA
jgi:predicted nuclease of predicted toxin-antitoxin system